MPNNKAMFSWESSVVGRLGGSINIKTSTSKHQNYPGGGVGARSISVRRAIFNRCEPSVTPTTRVKTTTVITPDYYTPKPFTSILEQPYSISNLTKVSSLTPLRRYMFKYNNQYLKIDDNFNLVLSTSTTTYRDILDKIFEATSTSSFRLDSELHCLYSLDCSSNGSSLRFTNNWGVDATSSSSCGYLEFQYTTGSKLKVISRQKIDISYSHIPDSAFNSNNFYVYYDTGSSSFKLTDNVANAASFDVYTSPIQADMPLDFNPYYIPYQPNPRVSIYDYVGAKEKNSISKMAGSITTAAGKSLKSTYTSQVSSPGTNVQTETASNAMLDTIYTTMGSANLRYSKDVYKAFRKAALSSVLGCRSIADGILNQNTAPYVYFTMEALNGVYHPFMVIASYSISDKPNRLLDVCRPPAAGNDYPNSSVTRDATLQNYLTKIPMRNYGNIEMHQLSDNFIYGKTLLEDKPPGGISEGDKAGITTRTPYNFASISAIGIAVDGVVIYPVLNNTLHPAQAQAEISNTGIHIGRGMGLHYHADGKSASPNNLNLYNSLDYVGHSHPPLIGFGFDGIALYGQYDSGFSTMHGYTLNQLDEFGGHSHDDYGYHYHAHVVPEAAISGAVIGTSGVTQTPSPPGYNVHILMKGAWKGKINDIPDFWKDGAPNYTIGQNSGTFVGME